MASKYRFFHRARVRASVAVAWNVFTDHERIAEFTNTPMTVIKPGDTERNGLGCIRRFGQFGWTVDEIVNIWRPLEVFGYHIINSEDIVAHQGVIRFFQTSEGGCEWVYDMQNVPSEKSLEQAKAAGFSYQDFLGIGFKEYMADLEAECERRADNERVPVRPDLTTKEAVYREAIYQ